MRQNALLTLLAALAVAGCADGAAQDEQAPILNPSVDEWCGQRLCGWSTSLGRIEPVSTWHAKDLGASFVETPTMISQRVDGSLEGGGCLLFDAIADVAQDADVAVLLDFNDDGVDDYEQQISIVRWQSVPFTVRTPVAYQGLRVSVIKRGEGRAVLALLRIAAQSDCKSERLTLIDGSVCSQDAVCKSGQCRDGRCTSLTPDAGSE